jgi:single-strand DNA-binding protein
MLNKVILIGNLGKDPEIRTLETGVKVATFSIATSETFKDKEGNRTKRTEWHNLVLWRGLAEISEKYLKKGNQIFVEGRLQTRSWDDQQTGVKKYTTEIVVDNMTMLGGKKEGEGNAENAETPEQKTFEEPAPNEADNDLPF